MTSRVLILMKRSYALLSSPELLFWVVGLWLSYYTTLVIWDEEAFAHYITGLQTRPVMQALFGFFLVVGYLNLARVIGCGIGRGIKRALLTAALPLGLMLTFTGAFISITTRQAQWLMVLPGDMLQPSWSVEQYRVSEIDPGIHESILDIELEKGMGLFKFEPMIMVQDSRSGVHRIGAFPPSRLGDTFFHVLNFGIAPSLSLSERGVLQAQEYVPLRMLEPGSSDTFSIEPLPYTFLVSLEAEKVHKKGDTTAAEYNMRDPLYRIRVLKGQEVIAEEITKDKIHFDDISVGFEKPVFWSQIEAVKDRGVYLLISGLFLILVGVPLYAAERVIRIMRDKTRHMI